MTYPTSVKVYVDFEYGPQSGFVSWTDVSQWVCGTVECGFGRDSVVDEFQPGAGRFTLDNKDARFDPTNSAGPYYGKLLRNRRVKIEVVNNAVTYVIARGCVEGWPQRYEGKACFVDVTFVDPLALLAQTALPDSVWEYRVRALTPAYAWYRLGDETSLAVDSSGNGRHGNWRVYEGAGGAPWNGIDAPNAVMREGQVDGIVPSAPDRKATSFALLQAEVGQPVGFTSSSGAPRTPALLTHQDTAELLKDDFSVELWLLMKQAFPLDVTNTVSDTTAIPQPLVAWGAPRGQGNRWEFGVNEFGHPYFRFETSGATAEAEWDLVDLSGGSVKHVILTVDVSSTLIQVYVDGQVAQLTAGGGGPYVATNYAGYPPPYGFPAVVNYVSQDPDTGVQSILGDVVFRDYGMGLSANGNWEAGRYGSITGSPVLDSGDAVAQTISMAGALGWPLGSYATDGLVVLPGQLKERSPLEVVRQIAASEQGVFYWSPHRGTFDFYTRNWPITLSRATTAGYYLSDASGLARMYADVEYGGPVDHLENDVSVSFLAGEQRAENLTSQEEHGIGKGSVDTVLVSASDALHVAEFRVAMFGSPSTGRLTPSRLEIQPNTTNDWAMCLALEPLTRVLFEHTRPSGGTPVADEYYVQSVHHRFDAEAGGEWVTSVSLSLADEPGAPFLVGSSTVDSSDLVWL